MSERTRELIAQADSLAWEMGWFLAGVREFLAKVEKKMEGRPAGRPY
jgi:hypothetical protein